jgi:hypothetical protein
MKSYFTITLIVLYQLAFSQSIVEKDGKYGLIDNAGRTVVSLTCDTIVKVFSGAPLFILSKNNKQAYIFFPNLDPKAKDWESCDFIYDQISLAGSLTTRRPYYHYLLLETKGKFRFLALNVGYGLTTGAFESRAVNGIYWGYQATALYDKLYRSPNFEGVSGDLTLVTDGKFGQHFDGDQIIEPEYDKPLRFLDNSDYLEAWKGDLMGVIHNGEVAIPIIFKENELFYGNGDFHVETVGKPMQYFNIEDDEAFTITKNSIPLLASDTFRYTLSERVLFGDTTELLIGWGAVLNGPAYSPFERRSREDLFFGSCKAIILIDETNGNIVQTYDEPNCYYNIQQDRFVAKCKPVSNSKTKVQVTIYSIEGNKVLYEFVVKSYSVIADFCQISDTDNGYYEIRAGKKRPLSLTRRVIGYINYNTLKAARCKKKVFK